MARFVEGRAAGPGLSGQAAAARAGPGDRLVFVVAPETALDVHATQHATADGRLVANFVLWADRAGLAWQIAPPDPAALSDLDDRAVVVVDPGLAGDDAVAALCRRVRGSDAHDWIVPDGDDASEVEPIDSGSRIVVVGDADRLHRVYPAVLAALGDAADAAGIAPAVRIVDPTAAAADPAGVLAGAAGVILPGGADLTQVTGQAALAGAALARDVPVLGLCLGMQSMTLAVARGSGDIAGAALAELDPTAPALLFEPIGGAAGRPAHRLGDVETVVTAGTRLDRRLASAGGPPRRLVERANHRYRLAPRYRSPLRDAGLTVAAADPQGDIDYVVEHEGAACFIGFQGHPELQSRPGAPHPGYALFLDAVRARG